MLDLYDSLVRGTRAELAKRNAQLARGHKLEPLQDNDILRWVDIDLRRYVSALHDEDKISLRILANEPGREVVEIRRPGTISLDQAIEVVRAVAL